MDYEHTIVLTDDTSYKEGGWINEDFHKLLSEIIQT